MASKRRKPTKAKPAKLEKPTAQIVRLAPVDPRPFAAVEKATHDLRVEAAKLDIDQACREI